MFYQKKIKYLDYYENGEKIRSGGFLKLEARDDMLRLELTVKGLYPTDSFVRDVLLRSGGREAALGQISIQNGTGSFQYAGKLTGDMGSTGISYEALREVRIPIGGTRELVCPLAEVARNCEGMEPPARLSDDKKSIDSKQVDTVQPLYQAESHTAEPTELLAADRERKLVEDLSEEVSRDLDPVENLQPAFSSLEAEPPAGYSDGEKNNTLKKNNDQKERSTPQERSIQAQGIAQGRNDAQMKNNIRRSDVQVKNNIKENDVQMQDSVSDQGDTQERSSDPVESNAHAGNNASGKSAIREERDIREKGRIRKEHSAGEEKGRISLREEKWQQLSAIYPHIQPFQDERDYLSINPADFVLFPSKFYRAVNNSFLLHGYYNYNHLILARMEQRGEIRYYIGVPGNYYDREKQVAIMFGFESFECAAEPAQTGDFGYYMMRTEL